MKPIYLSKEDHHAISALIQGLDRLGKKKSDYTERLQGELERAVIMDASAIPEKVVRLHSKVRIRNLDSDEIDEWTLVMPEGADFERKRLSILAPIGSAIIGFSQGDQIEWETPGGVTKIMIEAVEKGEEETLSGLPW